MHWRYPKCVTFLWGTLQVPVGNLVDCLPHDFHNVATGCSKLETHFCEKSGRFEDFSKSQHSCKNEIKQLPRRGTGSHNSGRLPVSSSKPWGIMAIYLRQNPIFCQISISRLEFTKIYIRGNFGEDVGSTNPSF